MRMSVYGSCLKLHNFRSLLATLMGNAILLCCTGACYYVATAHLSPASAATWTGNHLDSMYLPDAALYCRTAGIHRVWS